MQRVVTVSREIEWKWWNKSGWLNVWRSSNSACLYADSSIKALRLGADISIPICLIPILSRTSHKTFLLRTPRLLPRVLLLCIPRHLYLTPTPCLLRMALQPLASPLIVSDALHILICGDFPFHSHSSGSSPSLSRGSQEPDFLR